MYRGHKIVAWIPFGREITVSILLPYLLRDHVDFGGVIDEIWLCLNTTNEPDLAYARMLDAQHPQVTLKPRPGPDYWQDGWPLEWRNGYREPLQANTGRFPIYMTDRQTIYVRFDDDIVWVHPTAVETLAERLLQRRADTIAVFPLIWNNAISSYLAQRHGRIPTDWGTVGYAARTSEDVSAIDQVGWADPHFAERLHSMVLNYLEADAADELLLPAELQLGRRQQFSVSCLAIGGWEYADLGGVLSWDEEEHWLTMHHPGNVDRDNRVCGMAQVAHFSFFTQREHLLEKTNILERDGTLSDKVTGSLYYSQLALQQASSA